MSDTTGVFLAIDRCPVHGDFWAISVNVGTRGTRLTPSKCCGQWHTERQWKMRPEQLLEAARALEDAAEAAAAEGPWRVTTTGDSRWFVTNNHIGGSQHQELGPLFYESHALAVRDVLNRIAARAADR